MEVPFLSGSNIIKNFMSEKKFTAIIYCTEKQVNGAQFLKYRNISEKGKASFYGFAKKFPGASYINWYDKDTKKFIERIYIE